MIRPSLITQSKDSGMDGRKALGGQAMAIMLVLCLIWDFQQVLLKAAELARNVKGVKAVENDLRIK
jgi:hypothetical protein